MASGRILGRSANTDVRIAGLGELLKGLQELPADLGKSVIYKALGGAGAAVKKAAERNLDTMARGDTPSSAHSMTKAGYRKPGTVKRAIRVSRSKINKGQKGLWEVIVRVKPLSKKARQGHAGAKNPNDPYYWWWIEFGTSTMPARPFLRPAFESTKTQQLAGISKRMAKGLQAAARKMAARVNRSG